MNKREAQRALKALMSGKFDHWATKRRALEFATSNKAVAAAITAGYLEVSPNGLWVNVTTPALDVWQEELKPKPRPRKVPFKVDARSERALAYGEAAVELLRRAQPGGASAESRHELKNVAGSLLEHWWGVEWPECYAEQKRPIDEALTDLL